MSMWKSIGLVVVLVANFALAGGALYLANLSKPVDYGDAGLLAADPGDITDVAGYSPDAETGDVVVPLSAMQRGGNFRVDFTAGKETSAGRKEHSGTWDDLAGAVVYRPESQELVAVEVAFAITSLRTDADPLTNTVLAGEKWFDYEEHPTAVFACDEVTSGIFADVDATHMLVGKFTLNGITKDLSIPATIAFSGQTLTLDASFALMRSDFGVEKREGSLAGAAGDVVSQVDDQVAMRVRMTVSPDLSAVISELAGVIEAQAIQLDEMTGTLKAMENRLRVVEAWESRIGSGVQSAAVDSDSLPGRFTDHSPEYAALMQEDGSTAPGVLKQVPFEMILVPGNAEHGLAPFYMSQLEVTWAMMEAWSYSRDIADVEEVKRLILAGLRPTPLYGDPNVIVQMGYSANPARAMSRLTAESFCRWLSEKTGRRYRLPTEAEWEHAFLEGGGMPEDLAAASWHFDNAPVDDFFGPDPNRTPEGMAEVPEAGTRQPNALGLHDMLGSVSEWVIPENPAERALRGGNMRTRAADLVFSWREVEEPVGWFAAYPNQPHSIYWYPSYEFGGIRLVCEAWSVAENPPAEEAQP